MERCACAIIYWPGISEAIWATSYRCSDCNRNATSQATTPSMPSSQLSTPFEAIFADFFDYGGHHYLVVGDHLSDWVEVLSFAAGTDMGLAWFALLLLWCSGGAFERWRVHGGPDASLPLLVGASCVVRRFPAVEERGLAKCLLMSNTGPKSSHDQYHFLRAMIQLRRLTATSRQHRLSTPPTWFVFLRQKA